MAVGYPHALIYRGVSIQTDRAASVRPFYLCTLKESGKFAGIFSFLVGFICSRNVKYTNITAEGGLDC